jgi:hypothetical protein
MSKPLHSPCPIGVPWCRLSRSRGGLTRSDPHGGGPDRRSPPPAREKGLGPPFALVRGPSRVALAGLDLSLELAWPGGAGIVGGARRALHAHHDNHLAPLVSRRLAEPPSYSCWNSLLRRHRPRQAGLAGPPMPVSVTSRLASNSRFTVSSSLRRPTSGVVSRWSWSVMGPSHTQAPRVATGHALHRRAGYLDHRNTQRRTHSSACLRCLFSGLLDERRPRREAITMRSSRKQILIQKPKPRPLPAIDTRTPSGRVLPY